MRALWILWCLFWAILWFILGFLFFPFWLLTVASLVAALLPVGRRK